jgi:hypothetical protein
MTLITSRQKRSTLAVHSVLVKHDGINSLFLKRTIKIGFKAMMIYDKK